MQKKSHMGDGGVHYLVAPDHICFHVHMERGQITCWHVTQLLMGPWIRHSMQSDMYRHISENTTLQLVFPPNHPCAPTEQSSLRASSGHFFGNWFL